MPLSPSRVDLWFVAQLAKLLGRHRVFDLGVESAISHHVFGGFWFAACLFVFWTKGARTGGQKVRLRVLVILLGSFIAIILALLLEKLYSWPPPSHNSALAHFYPTYLEENINDNSFPSQSAALYAAVATGIFSLNRLAGWALWVATGLLVSLPRIYVGGHYPSDVFVGVGVGILGYSAAKTLLEPALEPHVKCFFEQTTWLRILAEFVVFVFIWQITVEFDEFVWLKNSLLQYVFK